MINIASWIGFFIAGFGLGFNIAMFISRKWHKQLLIDLREGLKEVLEGKH